MSRRTAVETRESPDTGKYRYVCADYAGCKLRAHCLKPGEDNGRRTLEESQLLLGEMKARLKKPENHAVFVSTKGSGVADWADKD